MPRGRDNILLPLNAVRVRRRGPRKGGWKRFVGVRERSGGGERNERRDGQRDLSQEWVGFSVIHVHRRSIRWGSVWDFDFEILRIWDLGGG